MRRHVTAVSAVLTAALLATFFAGGTVSAATRQTAQADAALRYLYGQVASDGSIASLGATEDTVISVADNGYDPATLRASNGTTSYSYLSRSAGSVKTAGAAAKYALAWLAAGRPAAFDGAAQLTRLNTATANGGFLTPAGTFHSTDPTVETANTFSQSLAVLADVAAGRTLPGNAVKWLLCAQRSDGGYGYVINDAAASPPAFCGDASSDTNDTAIALQAVDAAGTTAADAAARTYLHAAQRPDAGFGFDAASSSDPNSDAIVIQALVALGEDPTGSAWTKGGATPMSNLESFADPKGSGGYITPGATAPDAFTTSGIPQALALHPYGAATTIVAGSSPSAAGASLSLIHI